MTDQAEPPQGNIVASQSRALVVVRSSVPERASDRPDAEFLAQLIACKARLPAYRQARRASPGTATIAYAGCYGTAPALLNRLV